MDPGEEQQPSVTTDRLPSRSNRRRRRRRNAKAKSSGLDEGPGAVSEQLPSSEAGKAELDETTEEQQQQVLPSGPQSCEGTKVEPWCLDWEETQKEMAVTIECFNSGTVHAMTDQELDELHKQKDATCVAELHPLGQECYEESWDAVIYPTIRAWRKMDDLLAEKSDDELDQMRNQQLEFGVPIEKIDQLWEQLREIGMKINHSSLHAPIIEDKLKGLLEERANKKICSFAKELLKFRPLTGAGHPPEEILRRAKTIPGSEDLSTKDLKNSIGLFRSVAGSMELTLHPDVREGHMDTMVALIDIRERAKRHEIAKLRHPRGKHYVYKDRTFRLLSIDRFLSFRLDACQHYRIAKDQLKLHKKFDMQLSLLGHAELDRHMDILVAEAKENRLFPKKEDSDFSVLNEDLIRMSLKLRKDIAKWKHESELLVECLRKLVELRDNGVTEKRLGFVDAIMKLNQLGFLSNETEKHCKDKDILPLLAVVREKAFKGLPDRYVIEGINHYLHYVRNGKGKDFVLYGKAHRRGQVLDLWESRRCYDHEAYDICEQPLSTLDFDENGFL